MGVLEFKRETPWGFIFQEESRLPHARSMDAPGVLKLGLHSPPEECSYSHTLDQRGVLCLLSLTQCAALGVVREEGDNSGQW